MLTRIAAALVALATAAVGVVNLAHFDQRPPAVGAAGTVTKIVDGDTLDVSGVGRVRILLVDAPETHDNSHGSKDCFAQAAKARLAALVTIGSTVSVIPDVDPKDKYGRALRYVEAGGVDVGRQLVVEGLARVVYYPPNRARLDAYSIDEATARSSALNLWSASCPA